MRALCRKGNCHSNVKRKSQPGYERGILAPEIANARGRPPRKVMRNLNEVIGMHGCRHSSRHHILVRCCAFGRERAFAASKLRTWQVCDIDEAYCLRSLVLKSLVE